MGAFWLKEQPLGTQMNQKGFSLGLHENGLLNTIIILKLSPQKITWISLGLNYYGRYYSRIFCNSFSRLHENGQIFKTLKPHS